MQATNEERIRALSYPLAPQPTGETPRLKTLPGIKAALFDIYGTLLVSGSGDIGVAKDLAKSDAFVAALRSGGIDLSGYDVDGRRGSEMLLEEIQIAHTALKSQGVDYPEVEIADIWQAVVRKLAGTNLLPASATMVDPARLALEYELRVNPTWPMPGLLPLFDSLRGKQLTLGVISNAQNFTPEILAVQAGMSLDELGLNPALRFYSYAFRQAKPGVALYEFAAKLLAGLGIAAGSVLYVGNDMLNDITPAAAVGFRTALFAGDVRSLRWRRGDPHVAGVQPDVVVTELPQLLECVT